ncbi:MAG: hypothetical protein A2W03_10850 [Candidatus Aminicenantes bacterium RBG_16_63_16]|nr:MAG: hypothetical protein A2W03_10850 [Candidatus Aminicenantes bacterium RBG_16_63_16]
MKTRFLCGVLFIFLAFSLNAGEIRSLGRVFSLGQGLKDLDGDGLADGLAFSIVIPDRATPVETALAADIAARANLEVLAQDPDLVKTEAEAAALTATADLILIGARLKLAQELAGAKGLPALSSHQGGVFLIESRGRSSLLVLGGSDEALLKAGRAFFLRWPYFWEIWGREDGHTYATMERDIAALFRQEKIALPFVSVHSALYEFPPYSSSRDTVRRLKFDNGEIKDLEVVLEFPRTGDRDRALAALQSLKDDRRRGERTETLSYPGCSRVTLALRAGATDAVISLPRSGYPKRILTPSYKEPARRNVPERDFDLLSLFSPKGIYSDDDKDGLADGLESQVVVPTTGNWPSLARFVSRLVLHAAGGAFPIVQLETEVEDAKALSAPIFVGDSRFVQELTKTGKLSTPTLPPGAAAVQVVPQAFNKSSAVAITGPDASALQGILDYLGKGFPYLTRYDDGGPQLGDLSADFEKFLAGGRGAAEAFIQGSAEKILREIVEREPAEVRAEICLAQDNAKFTDHIEGFLRKSLPGSKLEVKSSSLEKSTVIFEKTTDFSWEADDAFDLVMARARGICGSPDGLEVDLGVGESPAVRQRIKSRIEAALDEAGFSRPDVRVHSAYKQGFFWLTEDVLDALRGRPVDRIVIRFAREKDDFSSPKRFYSEPMRWLQELYPADELMSSGLGLPLDRIGFEINEKEEPVYEATALDSKNTAIWEGAFSPRRREISYLAPLPEWGTARVTTGWLSVKHQGRVIYDEALLTDLEKFWNFYQKEVLSPLYSQVMEKTGNEPATGKQPYFKRLLVELWLSEPDFKLGLDEEIVSSLEAIHDEIYFDTLDMLRGMTRVDIEDQDVPQDASRLSAPGNVFPVVHPSSEGEKGRVKVTLEDWPAPAPRLVVKWKEKGRQEERGRTMAFPSLKPKRVRFPSLVYDGKERRVDNLVVQAEFEKEADYLAALEIIQSARSLQEQGRLSPPFSYGGIRTVTLSVKSKDLVKEEVFPIDPPDKAAGRPTLSSGEAMPVRTDEIVSPEMAMAMVRGLSRLPSVRSYIGGFSYEQRPVPVLEIFSTPGRYISLARLAVAKPTLFASARQHANEVSSTNYLLEFARLLAGDGDFRDYLKKVNFVFEPMENPDGAALAYSLQKLTPFHSLHAGRYGALGMEIGYSSGPAGRFLPEAAVRRQAVERWLPDISLNLHGYPSHEWVQAFSGYSPYLFRDYWIPKGWFAYYRTPRMGIYEKWRQAGADLKAIIIDEMRRDPALRESNEKFYARYRRWASRWQPHLDPLEIEAGLNIFAARRSAQEYKLTPRSQMTYVEETPELMDETARGGWLDFLCAQGLAFLRAHARYLSEARFEVGRIEEEIRDRVRIQFSRSRPGTIKN